MSSLQRIFYVSRRPPGVSAMDIQRVLWSARIRNRRLDITGALISSGAVFAQWLEGRAEALDAVMASIWRDARHCDMRVLLRHGITLRRFDDWSLAYLERPQLTQQIEALLQAEGEVPQAQIEALVRSLPRPEDLDTQPGLPARPPGD